MESILQSKLEVLLSSEPERYLYMTVLLKTLEDIDLSAVVLPDDKLSECDFFYSLLKKEVDRDKFRWLFGAFLNACYGHLEYKAAYFHYAHCDPESGETIEDGESLETLRKYVKVFKNNNKSGFVKTSGLSELMDKLYKYRNTSTHDGGVGIMKCGDDLPKDFKIGYHKSTAVSALDFCSQVLEFFSDLEAELNI